MNIYLGIDIGTSKICVLALDKKTKKPVKIISEENSSNVKLQKDFSEQNPLKIKEITYSLIDKIKKKKQYKIVGIQLTGQMHGMLFVDKNLKPLSNLITWQDKRSQKLIEEIYRRTKNIKYYECGCLIRPGYMGATLYWFYKNNAVPENVYKVCFIHDWISADLVKFNTNQHNPPQTTMEYQRQTSSIAEWHGQTMALVSDTLKSGKLISSPIILTDITDAASSGIFNIKRINWYWEFIEELGIPKKIFPLIKNPGEIIGFTKEGIAIGCAFGDNQASIFGSMYGYNQKGCVNINIGTGSQVSIIIDNFKKISYNFEIRPYLDRKYILVGASINGGNIYSVLKDFFTSVGTNFWKINKKNIFKKMNKLASKVKIGSDGLECLPYFFGEREKNSLRASFVNLDIHNFTVAHFCRAVLEGMTRILYNLYRETNIKRKYIVGSGNAIKRNKVLQKIIVTIFNMDLKLSPHHEESAYGASLLSMRECGKRRHVPD